MIGTQVESRPTVPVMGFLLVVLALALAAGAAASRNVNLAVGAILPGLMAAAMLLTREPRIVVLFTEEGLEHESTANAGTIPYDAIERVWTSKRKLDPEKPGPRSYPIVIGHPDGELRLSGKLDASPDDIYRHVLSRIPMGGSDEVHDDLAEYLAEQRAEFGDDRVWSYRTAARQIGPNYRRLRAVAMATVLGAVIWIVYGAATNEGQGWIGAGVLFLVFAGIFWLASFASSNTGPKFKGWKESSLVVGPLGLALVQGDVRGEMRWDELREVKLLDNMTFRFREQRNAGRGILLKVEGANIFLPEIYDRPLVSIHEAILHYWR